MQGYQLEGKSEREKTGYEPSYAPLVGGLEAFCYRAAEREHDVAHLLARVMHYEGFVRAGCRCTPIGVPPVSCERGSPVALTTVAYERGSPAGVPPVTCEVTTPRSANMTLHTCLHGLCKRMPSCNAIAGVV